MTQSNMVATDIERFLDVLWLSGEVHELRVPKYNTYGNTASGYFENPKTMASAAAEWDSQANLYLTLNPVNPALLARANNRIIDKSTNTASDADITRRNWLFLDIDADRPAGISSTEVELGTARTTLDNIVAYLADLGWPEPLTAMSGNGFYGLYGVDLPNDEESHQLVTGVLRSLAQEFDTASVHVDTTVSNAARIIGLVGTLKVKGDSLPERPHRRSRLESVPGEVVIVPKDKLEAIAGLHSEMQPGNGKFSSNGSSTLRLSETLESYDIEYREQPPDAQGIAWYHVRQCPFHDDGRLFECGVGQKLPDGAFAGKCFHPEGDGKGWREWKEALGISFSRNGHKPQSSPSVDSVVGPTADKDNQQLPFDASQFPLTDAGNAELFAALYGDRVRYDHARGRWLLWNLHRWEPDADGEIYRLAKEATRTRYRQAEAIEDLDQRRKACDFAIRSESRQKLEACLTLTQSELPIASTGEDWDSDPYLIGVLNGVVDLLTGLLRPGTPEDRITMQIPIAFDSEATCPRWEEFLQQVFAGDAALIAFIHRAVGYSLTGDVREQVIFLCYGSGANGKSKFLYVLRLLTGDYAANIPFTVLELHQRQSITNDLASMAGRRLVTSSETNESTRLNEARIKALTGGDPITARFLYKESFTFEPQAKFWLALNHLPKVRDDSYGFWRRVRVIPFAQGFTGADEDMEIGEKLKAESEGILAWAVRGALEWPRLGLRHPDAVMAATEAYQKESDDLALFIADGCVIHDDARVEPGQLYAEYQRWAEEQGIPLRQRYTLQMFGRRMKERFLQFSSSGKKYYRGVGIKGKSVG